MGGYNINGQLRANPDANYRIAKLTDNTSGQLFSARWEICNAVYYRYYRQKSAQATMMIKTSITASTITPTGSRYRFGSKLVGSGGI